LQLHVKLRIVEEQFHGHALSSEGGRRKSQLNPEYRILVLRCRRAEYGPSTDEIAMLPATMIDLAASVVPTVFRREV
jgi:hypothetical protein